MEHNKMSTGCHCAAQINTVATVAPLSRHRLTEIAQGAPASNYERREIATAERLTGVHMPDSCRGCPHSGAEQCCGGAV